MKKEERRTNVVVCTFNRCLSIVYYNGYVYQPYISKQCGSLCFRKCNGYGIPEMSFEQVKFIVNNIICVCSSKQESVKMFNKFFEFKPTEYIYSSENDEYVQKVLAEHEKPCEDEENLEDEEVNEPDWWDELEDDSIINNLNRFTCY